MSSNLRIDTSVDNSRLQALLAKQAEFDAAQAQLQAEIASLLPSSTSSATYHRSPIHKQHQQRRSNVPRSMSSTGVPSMSRHPSVGHSFGHVPQSTSLISDRTGSNRYSNEERFPNGRHPPWLVRIREEPHHNKAAMFHSLKMGQYHLL